jgi:hypothetical protein
VPWKAGAAPPRPSWDECEPEATGAERSKLDREAPELERRLVAILAAGVEGYSRLMHVSEEATMATLPDPIWRTHINELIFGDVPLVLFLRQCTTRTARTRSSSRSF